MSAPERAALGAEAPADEPRPAPLTATGDWLRLLGVIVVLVGATLVAGRMAVTHEKIAIAALAGGLGAVFVNTRFRLAVLLIPYATLLTPLSIPTGSESRIHASMVLVGALTGLTAFQMLKGRIRLTPSPYNRPLAWLSAAWIVALIWGRIWFDPRLIYAPNFIATQVAAMVTILLSFSTLVLLGRFLESRQQIKVVVWAFIVAGVVGMILRLGIVPDEIGALFNTHGTFTLWFCTLMLALLLFVPLSRPLFWLAVVVLAITLYERVVVDSVWLSGWLPAVLGMAVVIFLRSRRAFVVIMALALLLAAVNAESLYHELVVSSEEEGDFERLGIWERNLGLTAQHFLFGMGPAGYAIYNMSFFPEDARSTHNNFFDILAQTGVVGLGLFLWFMVAALKETRRLHRLARAPLDRALAATVLAGYLGSLLSMMLGDWVLPFAYNQGIAGFRYTVFTWIWLGVGLALRRMLDQEQEQERVATTQAATPDDAAAPPANDAGLTPAERLFGRRKPRAEGQE